ncbi:MAG: membrane protein insertase YidC [Gemmatimonadales bacterium]
MDRRTIWAILLMMAIAVAPAVFMKRESGEAGKRGSQTVSPADTPAATVPSDRDSVPLEQPDRRTPEPVTSPLPRVPASPADDTVRVTSPLYTYGISVRGGRLVEAQLKRYRSMAPSDSGRPAQILPRESRLLAHTLVLGRDTISLDDWPFTVSAKSLDVREPSRLRLSASRNGINLELTYTFHPDDYRVDVSGRVSGVGPNGGQLLVGMGPTVENTEANLEENQRELALVTRRDDTERTNLSGLEPGEARTLSGPFRWVALKSKYFVTGLLLTDSTDAGISGVTAAAPASAGDDPTSADIRVSLPLPPSGTFGYTVYAGPMEYERLERLGHDFDDVNPYGWPGFRTIIRIFAVPVRWLLVWMHENLHLAYGLVLVVFGILVRVLLWPLNQKAMRANMKLQEVQPLMKEIQERHKSDPQKVQQEMFKLYKEHGVNPLGGCWPLMLPMPILFALFFVFQNAIELRGTSFLWIPDLSRPDPLYVIPILMGASMYFLTKVGQVGMEPNPQMKMMLYIMPVMMTAMFLFFPSGLNLYYTVSNIASIPQQWMLARERQKRTAKAMVAVKTRMPEPKPKPAREKRKA